MSRAEERRFGYVVEVTKETSGPYCALSGVRLWEAAMTAAKTELAVASREALGRELRDHDFESPAGVSLDVLIAPLMQGDLDANTARKICDDIERNYRFYGEEGPLRDAVSWIELRRRVCAPGPSEPRALLDA